MTALRQYRQPALKFFSRDDRLPLGADGLGRNLRPVVFQHNPSGIVPVVEHPRHLLDVGFALAVDVDLDERTTITHPVAALVELLADLRQCVLVGEQQVPRITPDFCLLRVDLHPAFVLGVLVAVFSAAFAQFG
ncbi:MAG: hypothetical protein AAF125_09815 [Chloroflexota bacterium]